MSELIAVARELWKHTSIPSFLVGLNAGVFIMLITVAICDKRSPVRHAPPVYPNDSTVNVPSSLIYPNDAE